MWKWEPCQYEERKELLKDRTWWLADSSYQPAADKSVYVYVETQNNDPSGERVIFVFNDQGLYYSAFHELSALIDYLGGDSSVKRVHLNKNDMLILNGEKKWTAP